MHFTDNTRRAGSAPLLRGGGSRAEWFAFRRLPKKRAAARFTAARFAAAGGELHHLSLPAVDADPALQVVTQQ